MNTRLLIIGATLAAALLAAVLVAGAALWLTLRDNGDIEPAPPVTGIALPIPPVPPRIAIGRDYEQCLELLETDPAAAAGFATGWDATGGGDGATHCLALSRIALGHAAEGARILEKLSTTSTAATAARAIIYAQASQAWLMAGEFMRAYGAATLAIALRGEDPDLLIDRAVIAGSLDRFADAIVDLDHAIAIDPDRTDALTLRASAWRHEGKLDTAQRDLDRAMAIDPDYPEALLERGIVRQRRGDRTGAREDWQRAMDLAPDSATADLAEQNLALLDAGPDRK